MGGTPVINPSDAIDQLSQAGAALNLPASQPAPTVDQSSDQTIQPQAAPDAMPIDPRTDPELVGAAVHHGRLASTVNHVVDVLGNVLGGPTTVHVTPQKDGSVTVTHDPSTSGEKWSRVAQAALGGLAKGFAAGPGPGGIARAAAGGIDAGMQLPQQREDQATNDAKQQNDANQKKVLFQANHAAMDQAYVRNSEEMTRRGITFGQEQADRNNAIDEKISTAPGSEDLGTFTGVKDLPDFAAKYPQAMNAHVGDGSTYLNFIPVFDSSGKQTGSHVVVMNKAMGEQIMKDPPPIPTDYFDSDSNSVKTRLLSPAKGITYNDYNTAYKKQLTDNSSLRLNVQEKLHPTPKTAAEALAQASAATDPAEKARLTTLGNQLQTNAEREKAAGRAPVAPAYAPPAAGGGAPAAAGAQFGGGDPSSTFEINSQKLADGTLSVNTLPSRTAKGQPGRADYIARADQIDRARGGSGFDEPVIHQEATFAQNPKVQAAVQGIDRIVGRGGQLDQMMSLAGKAGLSPLAPLNELELTGKQWMGNADAKNFKTGIEETRRSIAGLMGNPLLGGSETDKKLEQAHEMLGQNPTYKNLQSAKAVISQALGSQRSAMVDNNRFLQRRYGHTTAGGGPAAPSAAGPATAGATFQPMTPPANEPVQPGKHYGLGPKGLGWYR